MLANLAEEVAAEMRIESPVNLRFDATEKVFVYDGLDDYYKKDIIQKAEARYGIKLRDFRTRQVKENAKKRGYSVKKEKTENDGKIKIVLRRRDYGV